MGLFDKWRSPAPAKHRATVSPELPVPGGFTVVDVETTGLSSRNHRVLEIAVVRTDTSGRVTGEWSRRIDPEGPVGATHIHGITADDVRGAPKFGDLIPHLNHWMQGTVLVAHNARFDLAFIRSEYSNAGWELPWLPSLCTLEASSYYLPSMDRRRLADCCAAARVPLRGAHSALGDARATAGLLGYYLNPRNGTAVHPEHLSLLSDAAGVIWPSGATRQPKAPGHGETVRARVEINQAKKAVSAPALVQLLADFSLIDALDEGAPASALPYLETLVEALEDGEISTAEADALDDVAATLGLSSEDRTAANRSVLLALCHLALEDGMVSRAEKAELVNVSTLLGLPKTVLTHALDQAEAARHERLSTGLGPLPDAWALGDPLRVGHKVAFTGCDPALREQLERRAEALGVRVLGNVSAKTAMLVTDGGFSGTKAEAASRVGCRIVHPDDFSTLLQHLQPAVPRQLKKVPPAVLADQTAAGVSAPPADPSAERDPAIVRQWARENGYAVGTRGRLHQDLFDEYAAHLSASGQAESEPVS
ncbi:exonuclease domain-containing protein [Aeromicrobium chenweiae]|nr:exonuclease domain-containing protein [Aeromicrobium chenweiae]